MRASSIRSEIFTEKDFSRKLKPSEVARHYRHFKVEETDAGFTLTAPATMTKYGAFDTQDRPATFSLQLPRYQLVVKGERHWPFEKLDGKNTVTPVYGDIADAIARNAFSRGAAAGCSFGVVPGDFRFNRAGNPVFTVSMDRKDAYFIMFYSDSPLHGFAGSRRYNMVTAGGIWMASIPIALVEQMSA